MGIAHKEEHAEVMPGKGWLRGRAPAPYRRDSWIDLGCAPRWQHRFPERTLVPYTGIRAEDGYGRGWQGVIHPDDLPELLE